MKRVLFIIGFVFLSNSLSAQTLEESLAKSVCVYSDSVNISKLLTKDDKRKAILYVFAKAVESNKDVINKDYRFAGLQSYEQGKKIGQLMSLSVKPILLNNCPKFKKLIN